MSKLIFIVYLFTLVSNVANAQYQVSGRLIDANNEPLHFANIVLSLMADSSFVNGTTSDFEGNFSISLKNENNYFVTISMIGFNNYISAPFALNDQKKEKNLGDIVLAEGGLKLKKITITARKPIF